MVHTDNPSTDPHLQFDRVAITNKTLDVTLSGGGGGGGGGGLKKTGF
jgi:hypothetical protein